MEVEKCNKGRGKGMNERLGRKVLCAEDQTQDLKHKNQLLYSEVYS